MIRVFPRRTSFTPNDDLVFIGEPPLIRPMEDLPVRVSCTFTWDIPKAKELKEHWSYYYPDVQLGGPAFGSPVDTFIPGRFIKQGVTFTSRGCNNKCPWCLVPEREGKLKEYDNFADGWIVNDNNFLQCSQDHRTKVYSMLQKQHGINFIGGLDARLLDGKAASELKKLKIDQIFLACDTNKGLEPLKIAVKLLGMNRRKLRCYVLIGREKINKALDRLKAVYEIGCMPHAQLYQPPDQWIEYDREWRTLARTFSRPAATKAYMK